MNVKLGTRGRCSNGCGVVSGQTSDKGSNGARGCAQSTAVKSSRSHSLSDSPWSNGCEMSSDQIGFRCWWSNGHELVCGQAGSSGQWSDMSNISCSDCQIRWGQADVRRPKVKRGFVVSGQTGGTQSPLERVTSPWCQTAPGAVLCQQLSNPRRSHAARWSLVSR